jgi:hypothetical protein
VKCLRGASAVQSVLESNPDPQVRVFAVWLPILPTDFTAPNTSAMARIPDLRVQQFWDPDHLVAKAIAAAAGPTQPQPDCCEQDGILWDLAAVYPKGARWDNALPAATFLNGPVGDVKDGIGAILRKQP